ncbi:MAG: PPK2 family polyphosphate kinase [Acidimicrobiales bacterium]
MRPGDAANLDVRDPAATEEAPGGAAQTGAELEALSGRMAGLQDRLWAEGRRSLLVVFEGVDTSGKDGAIRSLLRGLNPQGVHVAVFREPSPEELRHDFVWRVHPHVPAAGEIAVFNRSHYEDVLAARVQKLVAPYLWQARYEHINAFERLLAHGGTRIVKILLHLSAGEQLERLEARLDQPERRWRLKQSDLDGTGLYGEHQAAFKDMIERTSTDQAPWFVVPADHKWYRDWAVASIVVAALRDMDPRYPKAPGLPEGAARASRAAAPAKALPSR